MFLFAFAGNSSGNFAEQTNGIAARSVPHMEISQFVLFEAMLTELRDNNMFKDFFFI